MRKLKKMIAIGCASVMVVSVAGCSSTQQTSETTSESTQSETTDTAQTDTAQTDTAQTDTKQSEETKEAVENSVVFGKVTAIDGSNITLALGDMPQGNGMGDGQAPSGDKVAPNSDANQGDGQTSTQDKPSGEAPSDKGEAPSQDASKQDGQEPAQGEGKPSEAAPSTEGEAPDMSSLFEESGETLTITIEDESLIKVMSGNETTIGSLSDIAVDAILSIQYDESNSISSITIQK